ncbi:MAG: NUDIX pyrophosphatase [Bacteroidetes bacterium]|nr:NUDIX pyrophosphatase [Bacteroidota bacterium]
MPKIVCNIIEVCIFRFDNKQPLYLMLRRSKDETAYPDAWQIVTGSIEQGETAVQGALRELKEETGFIPQKFWIVPHVNTFYSVRNDTLNHTVNFAVQVAPMTDPILSEEHYQFGWYPIEQAKALCVWPGQIQALQLVNDFIVSGKKTAEFSEIIL